MEINSEAYRWCLNHLIKIYPVPIKGETHTKYKYVNGKRKKVLVPMVQIQANLDHNIITFPEKYEQTEELYKVINRLYEHYYKRPNS